MEWNGVNIHQQKEKKKSRIFFYKENKNKNCIETRLYMRTCREIDKRHTGATRKKQTHTHTQSSMKNKSKIGILDLK